MTSDKEQEAREGQALNHGLEVLNLGDGYHAEEEATPSYSPITVDKTTLLFAGQITDLEPTFLKITNTSDKIVYYNAVSRDTRLKSTYLIVPPKDILLPGQSVAVQVKQVVQRPGANIGTFYATSIIVPESLGGIPKFGDVESKWQDSLKAWKADIGKDGKTGDVPLDAPQLYRIKITCDVKSKVNKVLGSVIGGLFGVKKDDGEVQGF